MNDLTLQEFLAELCPRLRPVVARVMDCRYGCEILDFFRHRRLVWLEAADIANYVSAPLDQVGGAVDQLARLGLLEHRDVLGNAYYGLTHDAEILNHLEQFWTWRDDWSEHWQRAKGELRLNTARAERGWI